MQKSVMLLQTRIGGKNEMVRMRLDKLLTHMNYGSHKEVGGFIRAGRVTVDDTVIRDPAFKVEPAQTTVALDGVTLRYCAQRYYMLNKPAGVITANRDIRHATVLELFPEHERRGLFAVGRLDKDTEGLLLVTDDGAFSHALMSPSRHVEKEYVARITGTLVADAVQRFQQGLSLRDGTVCLPAQLAWLSGSEPTGKACSPANASPFEELISAEEQLVRVTLQEGKYHQVKRMLAAVGGVVVQLKRVRIGSLRLDEALPSGGYRALTATEIERLIE